MFHGRPQPPGRVGIVPRHHHGKGVVSHPCGKRALAEGLGQSPGEGGQDLVGEGKAQRLVHPPHPGHVRDHDPQLRRHVEADSEGLQETGPGEEAGQGVPFPAVRGSGGGRVVVDPVGGQHHARTGRPILQPAPPPGTGAAAEGGEVQANRGTRRAGGLQGHQGVGAGRRHEPGQGPGTGMGAQTVQAKIGHGPGQPQAILAGVIVEKDHAGPADGSGKAGGPRNRGGTPPPGRDRPWHAQSIRRRVEGPRRDGRRGPVRTTSDRARPR